MSSKDKENLKVLILVGLSASGKSTWSKEFVKYNNGWARVGRDDFRYMLKNQGFCEPKIEDLINTLMNTTIMECLNKRLNVIIDNTNLKESYINEFIKLVQHKADVEFRIFDISVDKAIERDKGRERSVGEEVIKKQYKQYKNLTDSYGFATVKMKSHVYVEPKIDRSLPKAVIFDVDGTLAHMNGKRSAFDWDKVDRDDEDKIVGDMARLYHKNGYKVLIVSGRDEECKDLTIEWLKFYNIPFDGIFMRPEGSFKKDTIIKEDIYNNFIKDNYCVEFVVDDRNSVVERWRSIGLKVLQCEPGNF